MVVELKIGASEKKDEEKNDKKYWTDIVPVMVPEARKKKAMIGCGGIVLIAVLVGVALIGLSVAGYFATDILLDDDHGVTRKARVMCETENCEDCYERKKLHGCHQCEKWDDDDKYDDKDDDDKDEHHSGHHTSHHGHNRDDQDHDFEDQEAEEEWESNHETYQEWLDLVSGEDRSPEFEEIIHWDGEGVYSMEVIPQCENKKPTFITVDTIRGYTAIKAAYSDIVGNDFDRVDTSAGQGYHCMLIDTSAIMADQLEEIKQFNMNASNHVDANGNVDALNLHIKKITSHFFSYGERVPSRDRSYLGPAINELCPSNVDFYYLISGEDSFRAQVEDLMEVYDVEYDDIFYFFADIYDAVMAEDSDGLRQLLRNFYEIVGFLPVGTYSDESPSGVGWSLNIDKTTFWHPAVQREVTRYEANFGWNGTLSENNHTSAVENAGNATSVE